MKISIIGGGSPLLSPSLCGQIIHSSHLAGCTLSLMDVNKENLDFIYKAIDIHNVRMGRPVCIETTQDMEHSLDGADFVVVSISTGGFEAMDQDLKIPEKYGIRHTVGDTLGPGGWNRAMRNIPVFYEIGAHMKRCCPNAWLLNETNPLTVLTRVPHKYFAIKSLGVCSGVDHTASFLASLAGFGKESKLDFMVSGIDHGSWFLKLNADGKDVLEILRAKGYCVSEGELPRGQRNDDIRNVVASYRAVFAVWKEMGWMPALNDRHCVENWPWFVPGDGPTLPYQIERTSATERREARQVSLANIRQFIQGKESPFSAAFEKRFIPTVAIIEALSGFHSLHYACNYKNIGQSPGMPQDAVVETRCLIDSAGVQPMVSPLPLLLQSIVLPHVLRQEAAVDIALFGNFSELVALVACDPLCSRVPLGKVKEMMKEMLTATQEFIKNPKLLEF